MDPSSGFSGRGGQGRVEFFGSSSRSTGAMSIVNAVSQSSSVPRGRSVAVVIVAAGSGSRAAADGEAPKQYRAIAGRPVLARTLDVFFAHPAVAQVVVAINPLHRDLYDAATSECSGDDRLLPPIGGGATRQASVLAGLRSLAPYSPDLVLVHDAARPFVTVDVLDRCIERLSTADGALVAVGVVDTMRRADPTGRIGETVPRDGLWAAQTPQGFRFAPLLAAHEAAETAGRDDFTDDAGVAEWAGLDVRIVEGDPANLKLTTNDDFARAETRLMLDRFVRLADIRVGSGYDVHALIPGDGVTLCGVLIPFDRRLEGHSDADVAMHALTDAILGAIGDGDIGAHFPPSQAQWRGCDSSVFLKDAVARVEARGGMIAHVDVTIVAEAPKVGPHREAMRLRLADILGIAVDRVAVKATTNEKLGFVGRREGIASLATATVRLPLD